MGPSGARGERGPDGPQGTKGAQGDPVSSNIMLFLLYLMCCRVSQVLLVFKAAGGHLVNLVEVVLLETVEQMDCLYAL